ncbi:MAG: MMPL family transporter [Chloroflexi bacterium]|nr:MMPL family transporter [Chloroflexota bacterium]
MSLNVSTQALARGSSRHPWKVIVAWVLVFVLGMVLIANLLGDALTTEFNFTNNPESKRGFDLLEERLRGPRRANEIIIVQSESATVRSDDAFQELVEGIHGQLMALGPDVILSSRTFYQTGDLSLVSEGGSITIIPIVMAGELEDAEDNIPLVQEIVDEADNTDGFDVLITGNASIGREFTEIAESDLLKGEAFGLPVALVILVLVFGTLASALIPVVIAIIAIVAAVGASALVGQAFPLSFFVVNIITMIGLAVGIDYSLFIVSRFREERAKGLEKMDAISAAGATASRTVLFSGFAVAISLLGMLIIPTSIFRSIAVGAVLVVVFAVLASLTLLPAILSLMGDKVNALRIPLIQKAHTRFDEERRGGFWDWVAKRVMNRAPIYLVVIGGLMVAVSLFSLELESGFAGVSTMPDRLQTKQGFLILEREFSFGLVTPAEVVIDGDIGSEAVQKGLDDLRALLASDPASAFGPPAPLDVNLAGDLALLSVPVAGDPDADEAIQAVKRLRDDYVPRAFDGVDAEVLVTGLSAFDIDFFQMAADYTPIVFAVVLGFSFVLLTIVFRSLVVPVKAIFMNLLSVGTAYGLVVLVFQKGIGNELLGLQQVDIVEAWIPLFLFTILFGLSMDYHVFLLSRIRERYDQTGDNTEAVAFGIRSTGRLITGAALIMVAVFSGFAAGDLVGLQQMGFGLAVAVLLDATLVRSILVPSSMKLLGKFNWYLPSALQWLPGGKTEVPQPEPAGLTTPSEGRPDD